jgi:hypothetical protein
MSEEHRDPFADLPLLGELRGRLETRFQAAAAPPAKSALRRGWLGRHSRVLLALGALLLAGGTATAAVTLSHTPSAPLSGSVPGSPTRAGHGFYFTEAGKQYRIVFAPQLSGGTAGWQTFIGFGAQGKLAEGGEGGSVGYPTHGAPLSGGAGVGFTSSPLPSGDAVDYVLTSPRVAAVRVGDRTIQTRDGSALPREDRAAVFFVPAGSPPIAIPPAGARMPYYVRVPALAPARPSPRERAEARHNREHYVRVHRLRLLTPRGQPEADANGHRLRIRTVLVRATPLVALSGDGREIAYTPPHPGSSDLVTRAWQIARPGERHPGAAARHPLAGACEVAARGLPGLQPQWGHVLVAIRPVTDAEGELLLSCVDTEYFLRGWPLDTAVLLDARRPGQTPGPIPGAIPVAGHPGFVNLTLGAGPGSLTARRIGNAWLVVAGGASLAQRLEVLGALRIAKLTLPAP